MATIILDCNNPTLVHPATDVIALIGNRDTENTIIWAEDQGSVYVDASGNISPEANLLDPLEYLTVDGTKEFWAMCSPVTPNPTSTDQASNGLSAGSGLDFTQTAEIIVTENVTSWTPSAVLIADAIAESGLALALAAAIAGSGFSFLAAPVLLYGGQVQPPTGTPGLVGVTLVNYLGGQIAGHPKPTLAQVEAVEAAWDTDQGTPGMGNNVSKRYYGGPSANFPLGEPASPTQDTQNLSNIAQSGAKLLISFKPVIDLTNAYTSQLCQDSFNQLVSSIAYAASVAVNGVAFTLYQEFNFKLQQNFGGAAGWSAFINFYGPAFKTPHQASNQQLWSDMLTATNNINEAWNNGSWAAQIDGFAFDAYCSDYTKSTGRQNWINAWNAGIAIAEAANLPFGIWEWGVTDGPTVPITSGDNFNFVYWNETFILGYMTSRLTRNLVNGDVAWYVSGTGQNLPQSDSTGTVTAQIQKIFQGLTSKPSTFATVAAGATLVLTPNKPSTGAGYAVANGLSYDISIALNTTAGSTVPFAAVRLDWYNNDVSNAQPVASQKWWMPMGSAGQPATQIFGRGPQRGQFLKVSVTNQDSVICTVNVQLNSTSRTVSEDRWRWDSKGASVPTFTPSGGSDAYVNVVGDVSGLSVAAGATVQRLFGLWAGPAFIRLSSASETGTPVMQYQFNPYPQGPMGSAAFINETPATEFEAEVILPRAPMVLSITNNGTAAHNANAIIVSQE